MIGRQEHPADGLHRGKLTALNAYRCRGLNADHCSGLKNADPWRDLDADHCRGVIVDHVYIIRLGKNVSLARPTLL